MASWVPSVGCGLVLGVLAVLLWVRRPPEPLWPILFLCQALALLWVVGDVWSTHSRTPAEKDVALTLLFTGSVGLTTAWWETARRYVVWLGRGRRGLSHPLVIGLPLGLSVLSWVLGVTNPWHGWVMEPVVGGQNRYAAGMALMSSWGYAITSGTALLYAWAAREHAAPAVSRKLALLAGLTLVPLLTHSFGVWGPLPIREDTVAIGLLLTSAFAIYAIHRRGLFNLLPVALHTIIQSDRNGMLLLDRGGRLVHWNPAAEKLLEGLLLEPEAPLLDMLARRLADPDTGRRLPSSWALTRRLTDAKESHAVFLYVGGGGERALRLSILPLPSRWGRLAAVCLRVEDVTREAHEARGRRSRAEEQERRVRHAESLALMAGGAAHELNDLLAGIHGRARSALDDLGRGLPVRRHLLSILQSTRFARELSTELLTYAGQAGGEPQPVDLTRLVEDALPTLRELVPSGVELRPELVPGLPAAVGDPTQLRQVVCNLVRNGSEAIGDTGGVVVVRTGAVHLDPEAARTLALRGSLSPGPHVLLEVQDSGCGMSDEERASAFDAFYSTKATGRGLGLAVVAGIVTAQGGGIGVESRVGWGSTFRIWLPVTPAAH